MTTILQRMIMYRKTDVWQSNDVYNCVLNVIKISLFSFEIWVFFVKTLINTRMQNLKF